MADTKQVCERIANLLVARKWGGSGDPVFHRDAVVVGLIDPAEFGQLRIRPAAIIEPGAGSADEKTTTRVGEDFLVAVVVEQSGDMFGTAALMGANRTSATSSVGRGLLEVQREVYATLNRLVGPDLAISLRANSGDAIVGNPENGYLSFRIYRFSAETTTFPTFQRPIVPAAGLLSEAGGTVTIDWDAPDDTTDLISYIVRRTSGRVPVANADEGTDVAWSAGTSTTDSPGAGTWTYSVFAKYADEGGATALHPSDFIFATVVVT